MTVQMFVIYVVVLLAVVALSVQFYKWVRRAQGTLDDDPYDHFDWEEWAQSLDDVCVERTGEPELPAAVKTYETAKKTRARVRKTVAKKTVKPAKTPIKKAAKRPTAKKKVTRG